MKEGKKERVKIGKFSFIVKHYGNLAEYMHV